ncbi:MAG TPA: M12 family metallo-peptidase [Planctomycetota bacterium]|nr:M12 family metallo-peptidase [Planctomycetota bacterium]
MLVRSLSCLLLIASAATAQITLSGAELSALRQDLAVRDLSLQELSLPAASGAAFSVQVALDGNPMRLLLSPHSMRSPDFQLLVQVESGAIVSQEPAPITTYRGEVEGVPGSIVAASLIDGQLTALIRLAPDLPVFGVQPASASVPGAGRRLHAVYSSADRVALDGACGTDTSGPWVPEPPVAPGPADADKVCEIACDADFEFYKKNAQSTTQTQTDVENVLNAVGAIYQGDVGISYLITTILVRTAEPDPYSSTSPGTLLNQFAGSWNSQQGAIPRDTAHLFTGKELDGSVIGIAQLSVICNKSSAYGLSQSKWTTSMLYRAGLTAHEIGHNWSAQHCDGIGDCSIMCSGIGGCAGDVNNFGQSEKNQILAKKNASACLSDPGPILPPTVSSLTPNSVKVFQPPTVTISGTNLSTTLKVTVGGIDVTSLNGLVSVGSTQVTFTPPAPTSLGSKSVTVTTLGGTSSALTLSYTGTNPPELVSDVLGFTGTPYTWSWGANPNKSFWLVVSVSSGTVMVQGQELLANYIIVTPGTLNGAGVGSLTANMPASAAGLQFLSQIFTFSPLVVSNITSTWVPY